MFWTTIAEIFLDIKLDIIFYCIKKYPLFSVYCFIFRIPPLSSAIQTESGMNIYDIAMMPLETWVLKKMRSAIMPNAYGDVLEVGIGNSVNIRYYDPAKYAV